MTVTLALETSSRRPGIALARGGEMLYDSDMLSHIDGDGFDLASLVVSALATAGVAARDIGRVAVDIGPGGLNAVRSGVAFANGLAHALGVPIAPVTSFEIMGERVRRETGLPVISVRGTNAALLLVGLYDGRMLRRTLSGPLAEVARELAELRGRFAIAGRFRAELAAALPGTATPSDVELPTARDLVAFVQHAGSELQLAHQPIHAFQQQMG